MACTMAMIEITAKEAIAPAQKPLKSEENCTLYVRDLVDCWPAIPVPTCVDRRV